LDLVWLHIGNVRRILVAAIVSLSVAAITLVGIGLAQEIGDGQSAPRAVVAAHVGTRHSLAPAKCLNPVAPASEVHVQVPNSELTAEVITYKWNGNVAFVRIPPAGWKPATASESELKFFDVPVRPRGGVALAQWKSEWIDHFSSIQAGIPCADNIGDYASTSGSR
jgi:hypothetical protein